MNNKATCFKDPDKLCIDVILTNCPGSLQNSCAIETCLSDFHKIVVAVMKTYIKFSNTFLSLLRKSKSGYFGNFDEKSFCDNKTIWSVMKPIISNKIVSNEIIILVEDNNVVNNDKKTARILNNFFSNIIKDLVIP